MRLNSETSGHLGGLCERFRYCREEQAIGIVHFGTGAFHRAHQAWYTDRAMDAGDRDWGIVGVSLRSADVAGQLNPQQGLYTVSERGPAGDRSRLVGSIQHVLVARDDAETIVAALASPATHIVSFTVTEKGYCRAPGGGLDHGAAGSGSVYPLLAEGLRRRRDAGLGGVTLLSCDNLASNGPQLERLIVEYLDRRDRELRAWFDAECACPSTMVDRIVPATDDAALRGLAMRIGLEDAAAVFTEPFSQWVIEDRFAGPRPRWERVGAEIVPAVEPFEHAKLRLLNGAHSALAYMGLARGHCHVHEAIADPLLRGRIETLMRVEAMPTLDPAPTQDLGAYIDQLLQRFANPALPHRLQQIAMDGSQKIPQRWLGTLADNQARGRGCPAILAAIAAWIRHLRGSSGLVDDPIAPALAIAVRTPDWVDAMFGPGGLLPSAWTPTSDDRTTLLRLAELEPHQ